MLSQRNRGECKKSRKSAAMKATVSTMETKPKDIATSTQIKIPPLSLLPQKKKEKNTTEKLALPEQYIPGMTPAGIHTNTHKHTCKTHLDPHIKKISPQQVPHPVTLKRKNIPNSLASPDYKCTHTQLHTYKHTCRKCIHGQHTRIPTKGG